MIKELIAGLVISATVIATGSPARALTAQDSKFLGDFFTHAEPPARAVGAKVGPETIIELAKSVCQSLDTGASMNHIVEVEMNSMIDEGIITDDVSQDIFVDYFATVNVTGIYNYCPWNKYKIEEFVEINQTYY